MLGDEIITSTGAACVSTVVGHPLDTIKIHLQTNHRGGTLTTARDLFRKGALFRGIVPPLLNAIVMNTVMFSVFRKVKNAVDGAGDGESSSSFARSMTAGLISGFATACISTPTDYVKIQAQLRGIATWDLIQETLRGKGGPAIFFRGHGVNLGREGIFTMVYLGLYDIVHPEGFLQVAATSSLTGAMAWVASYPFDTIKSIIQGKKPSVERRLDVIETVLKIWHDRGVAAFYRGCLSSTGRAMLVTSLRMITYDAIVHALPAR